MTGHDRELDQEIHSIQTLNEHLPVKHIKHNIGKINLKIVEGDPFCDVALVGIINNDIAPLNHVTTSDNYCLHLNPDAEDLDYTLVQDVQLFVNGDVRRRRAHLREGNFREGSVHQNLNGCIIFEPPIHKEGESGVLLTTAVDDDRPHIVNGLAILTGIFPGRWSVGQPLKRTIDRIRRSDERYKDLRIAGVRNYCATPEQ